MLAGLADAVLAIPSTTAATNFYLSSSDLDGNFVLSAGERLDRLYEHFSFTEAGDIVLVGEAAGWRGARQSGVPFTSAATVGLNGTKEASATAVHELLATIGMLDRALLWNAFPLHPHGPGAPRTNRAPSANELGAGMDALRLAITGRRVVCVGKKAEASVARVLGYEIPDVHHAVATSQAIGVRHPSHGGAAQFRFDSIAAFRIWNMA